MVYSRFKEVLITYISLIPRFFKVYPIVDNNTKVISNKTDILKPMLLKATMSVI